MKNKAFTLVEILVIITIIAIIIIWSNSMNFNKWRDREELELLKNSVVSKFETVRNNSMMWKWVWTDLDHPTQVKITFSTWSDIMKTEYNTWTLTTNWLNDSESYINDTTLVKSISKISCLKIDDTPIINVSSWVVLIEWDKLTLTWWCNYPLAKKLQLNFKYKNEISTWTINIVNWLIEY